MTNWEDIHEDFGKHYLDKTYQQVWEKELGIDYQEAQKWIELGFKPGNHDEIRKWKNLSFNLVQIEKWIRANLSPWDFEFAAYLRNKDYQPNLNLNLKKLKKEFNNWKWKSKPAQEYLDIIYPFKQRKAIKTLNIGNNKLVDCLDLSDFINLEILLCSYNQLTTLDLTKLNQLKGFDCRNNHLQDIKLPSSAEKLTWLDIKNNNLSERNCYVFSRLSNLEYLYIGNWDKKNIQQGIYNNFVGSLEHLQNLTKLRELNISNTDIDSGLEYLPDSLERFWCETDYRKNAKCKKIYRELNPAVGTKKNVQEWKKANLPKLNRVKLKNQVKFLEEENQRLIQRIANLETLIQENQRLIKEQKQKIGQNVRDYLPFIEEENKKDIQRLIEIHKLNEEAEKFRQWKEVNKLSKQFASIRKKLESKLGEDFVEIITMILTNFKELYQREWDLQKQLKEKENKYQAKQLVEKNLKKSKQTLIEFDKYEEQITENNYLLGKLGKVEEIVQEKQFETKIVQNEPFGMPSSSKPK